MYATCTLNRDGQAAIWNVLKQACASSLNSWRALHPRSALHLGPLFHPPYGVTPAGPSSGSTTLLQLNHCLPRSGNVRSRWQRTLDFDPSAARSAGLDLCKRVDLGPELPHVCIIRQPSHGFVTSAASAQSFGRVSRLPLSEEDFATALVMDGKQMCDICQRSYCLRHFQVSRGIAGGRFPECRGCVYEDKQRRRHTIKGQKESGHPPTQGPMCCRKCGVTLPARFFAVDSTLQQGRRSSCLTCHSERDAARPRVYEAPAEKECSGPICNGSLQPADSFRLCRLNSTGLQSYCKRCAAAYERQHDKLARAVPYGLVM